MLENQFLRCVRWSAAAALLLAVALLGPTPSSGQGVKGPEARSIELAE